MPLDVTPNTRAVLWAVPHKLHFQNFLSEDQFLELIESLEKLIVESQDAALQQARMALHQHPDWQLSRKEAARIVSLLKTDRGSHEETAKA
jgi:hypothetical protein